MNILKKLLISAFMLTVMFSCEDKSGQPYQIEDIIVDQGAFIRLQAVNSGEYDLSDISTSVMSVDLEHWDPEDGSLLQDAVLTLQFIDNTPADVVTRDVVTVGTYDASQWTADPDTGLPNITIDVTAPEALALLNLTTDDIDGGDTFRFEWTLNLTNGKSFNRNNSSSSLPSWAFYSAPFLLDVNVICSLPDGFALGSYTLTQDVLGSFAGGTFNDAPITVELVEGATPTQRSFNAIYLEHFAIGNGANPFAFNLVCGRAIFVDQQASGLRCGTAILLGPADNPGSYDVADDGTITLTLKEDITSDCGGPPADASFTLTRN